MKRNQGWNIQSSRLSKILGSRISKPMKRFCRLMKKASMVEMVERVREKILGRRWKKTGKN